MNSIEVTHIKKYFKDVRAVDDVSFQVKEGTLFSLLGPNGAGKSTLLNILCTLQNQSDGEATVLGYSTLQEKQAIRRSIGIVFQNSVLDDALSGYENLSIRSKFYYKEKSARKAAIEHAIQAVSAQEFIHRPYGKLSGGQRRRLDIARAMLPQPKLLFLDEPTTGLDPRARHDLWETIQHIQKEHPTTILLTTHYMEEANISDQIIMMDHGMIIARGAPEELKTTYRCATLDEVFLQIHKEEIHYDCID